MRASRVLMRKERLLKLEDYMVFRAEGVPNDLQDITA